jgi:hypothetical protein
MQFVGRLALLPAGLRFLVRPMRVLAGMFAVVCLLGAACRMPGSAPITSEPNPAAGFLAFACPDGKASRPGLIDFGAYIGTWQALHERIPQSSDYVVSLATGRLSVQCSATDYVIRESIDLTFPVPSGRAVLLAMTELPTDSIRIYDRNHAGCRTLQYRSRQLATQLPTDDRLGLANITISNPSSPYSPGAASLVVIQVGAAAGDSSRACGQP